MRGPGGCQFRHVAGSFAVPERWTCAVDLFLGRETVLGFRPETVGVAQDAAHGGAAVRGVVDVVEPMGAETFVQVVTKDGTRVVARVSPDCVFVPGAEVEMPVSLEHAVFFDAVTGCAIGDGS